MKKKRAQARKRGVEIPPSPELAEHADRIRVLGRQTFDGVIEIGQRLVRCRELLKTQRVWLAWLEAEFGWSRRTADRFIDLFRARDKVRKLRTLGVGLSGLYLLAKASPEVVEGIERHVEAGHRAGHRVPLAEIERRMRADAKRARIEITAPSPDNGPRRSMASPPEAASKPPLTAEDFQAAGRRDLVDLIVDIARSRLPRDQSFEEARAVVESVGTEGMRERFSEAVAKLYDFVGQLQRALNERRIEEPAPTLRVIHGKDDPR
jgi:hypothetical protein